MNDTLSAGGFLRYRRWRLKRFGIEQKFAKCKATGYTQSLKIRNFLHRGLRRLYTEDSGRGFSPDAAERLRRMLTVLQDMRDPENLNQFPLWRVHQLSGDRAGTWSLRVTRNWRLTFRIENGEIQDVNYEDYH